MNRAYRKRNVTFVVVPVILLTGCIFCKSDNSNEASSMLSPVVSVRHYMPSLTPAQLDLAERIVSPTDAASILDGSPTVRARDVATVATYRLLSLPEPCCSKRSHAEEALAYYKVIARSRVRIDESRSDFQLLLLDSHLASTQLLCKAAVNESSDNIEHMLTLSQVYLRAGQLDECENTVNGILDRPYDHWDMERLYPSDPNAYYIAAVIVKACVQAIRGHQDVCDDLLAEASSMMSSAGITENTLSTLIRRGSFEQRLLSRRSTSVWADKNSP